MLTPRISPGLLVLTALALLGTAAQGAYVSPQSTALDNLRDDSFDPVSVRFHAGFPVSVTCRVPWTGSGAVERAENFLDQYANLYQLDHPDTKLVYVHSEESGDGSIVRFAQEVAGFPVFGAEIVVRLGVEDTWSHGVLGTTGALMVAAFNDELPPRLNDFDREAAITEEMAEDAARAEAGNPAVTVRGKTRLMIYEPSVFGEESAPKLAYRVTLDDGGQYLIDANTGVLLAKHGVHKDTSGLDGFELDLETANGGTAESTNCYNPTTIDDDIGDEDGLDVDFHNDADAVLAWFGARRTYQTFHDQFSRHSFDGDDGEIVAYVHVGFSQPNANAIPGCGLQFGDGSVSADVFAHEFTHLLIDEESNLVYMNQSGALNESLADVLGTAVDPADWLIGEETGSLGTLRNLSNPPSLTFANTGTAYPDRMSQFNNWNGQDNGGVHFNSSIINKAFFLIADGGFHNGRTVNGIGRTKMQKLAFKLAKVLGANSSFNQARDRAVGEAEFFRAMNFHGYGDAEVCTVRNAFAAVELGFGDLDCDNIEDNVDDSDGDGILDDGDLSGSLFDNPCAGGQGSNCDDNCRLVPNPSQKDFDQDGTGDACDTDADNDGIPEPPDACPNQPGTSPDTDNDGFPDCLDGDDDNDGVKDDGDNSGDPDDNPCPPFGGGAQPLCDDNCRLDYNPMQEDGDLDGRGDACHPDYDGDGVYGGIGEDNCPWTYNPDQLDSDFDSLGDACDQCPFKFDFTGLWLGGIPELNIPPTPFQPDSDHDGDGDACDFDGTWAILGGDVYHDLNAITAEGYTRTFELNSDPGADNEARLPLKACATSDANGPALPAPGERFELSLDPFPGTLSAWVEDDWGRVVGKVRPAEGNPDHQGLIFRPRCDREYTLVLRTLAGFDGYAAFDAFGMAYDNNGFNPYSRTASIFADVPTLPQDSDEDGIPDFADSCPFTHDPTDADADGDMVGDLCDNCPTAFNPDQGQAEFPTILAVPPDPAQGTTQSYWSWDGVHEYSWVAGPIHGLPSYAVHFFGSGTGDAHPVDVGGGGGGTNRYYLFRFTGDCGTWGSVDRDNDLPLP